MCGICGFNFNDKALLKRVVKAIEHRGPDDKGYYEDSHISLGHARLSIIDLSKKGRQPLSNEEGDVWITYNGEIYNYIELRDELEKKGHDFSSDSDTEVIVHAYEEYGQGFVNKLRGMFSFALWDSRNKKLILARDPIGKKPLYYYFDGQKLIFASEIKALLEAGIRKEVDRGALHSYLAFGYTLGRQTMFKGVEKVLGGQLHIFDFNSSPPKRKIHHYWNIEENIGNHSEEHYVKKLRKLLEESASLRLRSDVPVGAFLSGGIDSSTAVAFARDKVDYDFHTFSMGFEGFSELPYAREVAEHLNTEHHELIVREPEVVKNFPKITWHYDEPVADPAIIANYFLSKEAKKHVKTVLVGEAGDELFAGYGSYKDGLKFRRWFNSPRVFRQSLRKAIEFLPNRKDPWLNRTQRRLLYLAQETPEQAHLYHTRGKSDWELEWLLGKNSYDSNSKAIILKNIKLPLNQMQAIDCKNLLPEKFLMKADKATMAKGVEERLVFLDKKIVDFAFSLPPSLKIKNGRVKHLLRRAAEEKLPKEILWRKKQGFGVPIDTWLKCEMKDYALQKLNGRFLQKNFQREALKKIQDKVKREDFPHYHAATVTWSLVALEEWYEECFSNFS